MSIELSMEYSDDFYEAEVKDVKEFEDQVDSDDCLETWQCSSPVEQSFLDLEPISEAEQSSLCVELMKRLNMQRQQSYFCNITLVAKEGNEFKAHRNVLSAASPFFSKLLQSEMKAKEEGVIRFDEISKSVLSYVLEFIYTGSVEINEKNARNLIIAADYLLLESLKIIAGRFLEKQMSIYNCISTFLFAEKYRCDKLVLRSTKFIQDNFTSVAKSDEFLKSRSGFQVKTFWLQLKKMCSESFLTGSNKINKSEKTSLSSYFVMFDWSCFRVTLYFLIS